MNGGGKRVTIIATERTIMREHDNNPSLKVSPPSLKSSSRDDALVFDRDMRIFQCASSDTYSTCQVLNITKNAKTSAAAPSPVTRLGKLSLEENTPVEDTESRKQKHARSMGENNGQGNKKC
jgi:hypothetical protein